MRPLTQTPFLSHFCILCIPPRLRSTLHAFSRSLRPAGASFPHSVLPLCWLQFWEALLVEVNSSHKNVSKNVSILSLNATEEYQFWEPSLNFSLCTCTHLPVEPADCKNHPD